MGQRKIRAPVHASQHTSQPQHTQLSIFFLVHKFTEQPENDYFVHQRFHLSSDSIHQRFHLSEFLRYEPVFHRLCRHAKHSVHVLVYRVCCGMETVLFHHVDCGVMPKMQCMSICRVQAAVAAVHNSSFKLQVSQSHRLYHPLYHCMSHKLTSHNT